MGNIIRRVMCKLSAATLKLTAINQVSTPCLILCPSILFCNRMKLNQEQTADYYSSVPRGTENREGRYIERTQTCG